MINEKLVDVAWSILNVAEREIMYLCSVEEYTAAEIAIETNVSRGAVLSRIYHIRHKVVEAFEQHDISMCESRAMEE
jgi:DNA-directed RNA polymerase specialized sigma24 family protein